MASVTDLREAARRRVPRGIFDYIDGGADDEHALDRNSADFNQWTLRPRVLRDMSEIDLSVSLLGTRRPSPLVLAPTGFTRIAHSRGELAVAEVAGEFQMPYALSTLGTSSIEDFAATGSGPKWFQVYVWRDRGLVKEMVERASAASFDALCVTVDFARLGNRERDVRRGFTLPPQLGLGTMFDAMRNPQWTWDFLRSDPIRFANVTSGAASDGSDAVRLAHVVNNELDPSLTWADIEWLRSLWAGPLVVKGIQDVDDARIASEIGVDAVALSNHGGRQLDAGPSPVELIGATADSVGERIEIICDGGIRRGSDVVKALALGADACMVGRPYLWGLAAGGTAGVRLAATILLAEIERTMALIGAASIADLGPESLRPSLRHRNPHDA